MISKELHPVPNSHPAPAIQASAVAEALALAFTNADIPLDRVRDNPKDHRRADAGVESQEDQELTESIRARGVLVPVIVWEDADGFFHLVDGHRRCRCARRAGLKTVSARKLSRQPTDDESTIVALLGNTQRKDIHPIEFGLACLELMPTYRTATEIAKVVHRSISTVTRAIALVEQLAPDVRELVRPGLGGLPAAAAQVLTGLAPDHGAQRRFAQIYLDQKMTAAQLAAAIKGGNGQGDAASVAGFTCQENGVKIAVTLPGQDLAAAESALRTVLKDLGAHGKRGLEHFKQFLDTKARAVKKAAEFQQAQDALTALSPQAEAKR